MQRMQQLAQAEAHIAQGERTIARQQAIVAALERHGHDASFAGELLTQFRQIQALYVADRDRIRRILEKAET